MLMGIKFIIKYLSKENYMKISFIIQIGISRTILLFGLCYFSKLCYYICCGCEHYNVGFKLFNYLLCIFSFII